MENNYGIQPFITSPQFGVGRLTPNFHFTNLKPVIFAEILGSSPKCKPLGQQFSGHPSPLPLYSVFC